MPIRALRLRRFGQAIAIPLLLAVVIARADAAGKPTPVYSVTSTVFDTDPFGNETLLQGERSVSGSAVYADGANGVYSRIDATGQIDWNLDLSNSGRGFYLTVVSVNGDPIQGFASGPVFYSGRVISRCFDPSGQTTAAQSWFGITDDNNCAMRVNFASGGNQYSLVMSPLVASTGRASVHCNAFSGANCVDWTIATTPEIPNAGVANLYLLTKRGDQLVAVCKLTYRMHVTYP
jgi:hypothetical protein